MPRLDGSEGRSGSKSSGAGSPGRHRARLFGPDSAQAARHCRSQADDPAYLVLRSFSSLAVPPRCALCERPCEPEEIVCARCERALRLPGPVDIAIEGAELSFAALPYRGPPRRLATTLKYRSRPALAATAAAIIAERLPPPGPLAVVVPVPPAPARLRSRGFDSAEAIAAALARRLGVEARACLRRDDGPRQVGRSRGERLRRDARIRARGRVPESVVLVDDVTTTGATLAAGVAALRAGGAAAVWATSFCRAAGGLARPAGGGLATASRAG